MWINIDEMQPEGDCLVYLDKESLGRRIHSASFGGNIKLIGHYFAFDIDAKITHWMPLPAPPGQE